MPSRILKIRIGHVEHDAIGSAIFVELSLPEEILESRPFVHHRPVQTEIVIRALDVAVSAEFVAELRLAVVIHLAERNIDLFYRTDQAPP
jgi:hypothetical protein